MRSDIAVQNVHKILFGANKGRSHKTSRYLIKGSFVAGTTVIHNQISNTPSTCIDLAMSVILVVDTALQSVP